VGTEQDFFKSYSLHQNQKIIVQLGPRNHRKTNKKRKFPPPTFSLTLAGPFATKEGGRISSNPTVSSKSEIHIKNQKFIVKSRPPNDRKTNKKTKFPFFPTFSLTLAAPFASRDGGM
jgi:hypothetical protein